MPFRILMWWFKILGNLKDGTFIFIKINDMYDEILT